MLLHRLVKSDGLTRVFELPDGEHFSFRATRACQGDLGQFEASHAIAESRCIHIDNWILAQELELRLSGKFIRAAVSRDDFLDIEDSLVTKISEIWDKKVDQSMKALVNLLDDINEDLTEELISGTILPFLDEELAEEFYNSPELRKSIKRAVDRSWKSGKQEMANLLDVTVPRTAYIDNKAQQWLRKDTGFWLRWRWENHTRRRIADTAVKVGIEQGVGRRELGRTLAKAFKGVCGENAYYWEVVGSAAVTRSHSWSSLVTMDEAGIVEYTWNTVGDERVCRTCGPLHGTVFKVQDGINNMNRMLDVTDYVEARNISPWIHYSPKREREGKKPYYYNKYDSAGEIVGKRFFNKDKLSDGKFLSGIGMNKPQAHGGCRCNLQPN